MSETVNNNESAQNIQPLAQPRANDDAQSPPVEGLQESELLGSPDNFGHAALVEFFTKQTLTAEDEGSLFQIRGLTTVTGVALQFRSNPRSNQKLIEEMAAVRGWPEMIAAGLALPADPTRKLGDRANPQFCGKGQAGKIPKAERKRDDLKVKWDWTHPVLIPIFDRNGRLVGFRPHKGGASAGTAAGNTFLYIPRAFIPPFTEPEKFSTVVITEGEFKAAALWQTVGIGARQFVDESKQLLFETEPYGVCALPGISYARNPRTRMMLDEWLRSGGCRQVIVAFDREEKGDPKLPGYEPDPGRRYDSLIYAFYLASDLARTLHIRARVCLLPKTWMNAAGKADWDGALASMAHTTACT
jgi:hypothetical protein